MRRATSYCSASIECSPEANPLHSPGVIAILPTLSRRELVGDLIGTGLALTISRDGAADERAARKFTVDLVCGNIGVRARLPEAIALAHQYVFESVAPDAGYLKSLSENQRLGSSI
jgi:hypothetical protein